MTSPNLSSSTLVVFFNIKHSCVPHLILKPRYQIWYRLAGGSSKILLAAGGSVEPFWALYANHQQPEVLALLEEHRIGNLTKGEETLAVANMEDPYANEPRRHPALTVRSQKPFNAEPPPALLVENYITPT